MDATNNIATDLFYKIRSRFRGLKLGAEDGVITIQPQEARFFDFDYMEGENPIGHVSISLAEPNSMKVYFSTGITEGMDRTQKSNWYAFLKELRQFAKRRLMSFDTRDIAKDNLDQRDYAFLSQNSQSNNMNKSNPVGESIMSESAMYGTKTVSYQKLLDTRLIIKHSHALTDDTTPGARSRNISALFVENQDGERFKYPFIHLAGARAMQRHVANNGLPYDEIGKSIIGMSEQIAQLRSFNNYVVRNDLMNSNTNGIVERSSQALNQMREQLKALSKQSHYEAYRESFQAQQPLEVPEEVVEDFTEKFTVKNFKEDIKAVFPVLYRLMQENSEIGYDDIVAMTTDMQSEEVKEENKAYDPFAQFEEWAMTLGEGSAITSLDNQERAQAVRELQELVKQHFPAGVDGTNAIESLKGIIEDPQLDQAIKQQAEEDSDSCVRGLVMTWLEQNAPEVLDELDFGDYEDDRYQDPMQYANDAADADADYYGKQEGIGEARNPNFDTTMWISNPQFDPKNINYDDDTPEELEVGVNYTATMTDPGYGPSWGDAGGDPGEGPTYEFEVYDVVDLETGKTITKDPGVIDEVLRTLEEGGVDYAQESTDNDKKEPSKDDQYLARDMAQRKRDMARAKNRRDIMSPGKSKFDVKELAEFVHTFYDKASGTFPKGPEGVATMVGKKFGEQAEHVARKMVERMAPQQQIETIDTGDGIVVGGRVVSAEHPDMKGKVVMIDPKLAQRVHVQWDQGGRAEPVQRSRLKAISNEEMELDRIKQLSGVQNNTSEVEAAVPEVSSGAGHDIDEEQLSQILTRFEKAMDHERMYGDAFKNYDTVLKSLQQGDLESAVNATTEYFADQDGDSDPRWFNWDPYWNDLEDAFSTLLPDTSESVTPELEDIKRLSGIAQGIQSE